MSLAYFISVRGHAKFKNKHTFAISLLALFLTCKGENKQCKRKNKNTMANLLSKKVPTVLELC
jgi:hypothetical protein